jgi:FixJ family two-component response regulator
LTDSTDVTGTVFVIDDDPSVRRAITRQLGTIGFRVEAFASAREYLDHPPAEDAACIVSDVRMPGMDGLDLQATLERMNRALPIVFITGHGDIHTSVRAMKAGAVDFLSKPFSERDLLKSVVEALIHNAQSIRLRREDAALRSRYESLTSREREVFGLVTEGLLNKVVADRLGIAEKTIKIHRGRAMEKMGATSLAELVRMAERLSQKSSSRD